MGDQSTDTNASNQDGNSTGGSTSDAGDQFTPITSQDDLNRVIADRLGRERAKFSDYADLKAKAEKYDELEAANKSEIERANDAKTAAEERAAKAEADALRLRIATQHGITDADDIDLFLTGTDEETLKKQAERLGQRSEDRKKTGNVVPKEGKTHQPTADGMTEFTRTLFRKGD